MDLLHVGGAHPREPLLRAGRAGESQRRQLTVPFRALQRNQALL
jgi:hypothetical protein